MKHSTFIVLVLVTVVVGFTGQSIADLNSLRGADSVPATQMAPELLKFVNDKENIERTFEEQPPLVPHSNEKYTINLTTNKCLDCHMKQEGKDKAKSVEMSESHFVDRSGKILAKPTAARHFCNQCHVPQVDAPPLVGSTFQAVK